MDECFISCGSRKLVLESFVLDWLNQKKKVPFQGLNGTVCTNSIIILQPYSNFLSLYYPLAILQYSINKTRSSYNPDKPKHFTLRSCLWPCFLPSTNVYQKINKWLYFLRKRELPFLPQDTVCPTPGSRTQWGKSRGFWQWPQLQPQCWQADKAPAPARMGRTRVVAPHLGPVLSRKPAGCSRPHGPQAACCKPASKRYTGSYHPCLYYLTIVLHNMFPPSYKQ